MSEKPFFAYRSFWKQLEMKKRFYEAGIRQFCVFPANTTNSVGEPYCEYPTNWKWYDKYDFSVVDEQFEDLLSVAPEARILCMLDLNSPNWLVKNLNIAGCFADSFLSLTDALTTKHWVNATKNYLAALIQHIEKKYGDRILTYLLACGTTDEWMDYSKGRESAGKLAKYQQWCKDNDFEIPENIPVYWNRFNSSHELSLRDPKIDTDALRYWKFHSEVVADGIIDFADHVKTLVPEERKIGVFYGYILQLAKSRLVQCGHLAYEKVLAADSIDYVTSPGIYNDRAMGGGGGFMNVNGTVKLNGKSYFHEIDHATYTSNWDLNEYVSLGWMVNWPDEKASIAGLRREFCRSLLHGTSLWWFDMWGGFYDNQNLVDEIGHLKNLWDKYAAYEMEPDAEIAVIVDPESTLYLNDEDKTAPTGGLYTDLLTVCNRLGTPYQVFTFSDIPNITDLDKYKTIIFPGLFEVTQGKMAILNEYILKNNRTVIWTYAAGVTDGVQWMPENMPKLSGADLGSSGPIVTDREDWRSVYFASTDEINPELLRELVKTAGVHLYTDIPVPLYANKHFLAVHVADSCQTTIRLRKKATVQELLTGEFSQAQCNEFTYSFDGPETVLFTLS
jgi:hypothetical protein